MTEIDDNILLAYMRVQAASAAHAVRTSLKNVRGGWEGVRVWVCVWGNGCVCLDGESVVYQLLQALLTACIWCGPSVGCIVGQAAISQLVSALS